MTWRSAGPRVRLWMKLAALAAVGVVVIHAAHLYAGNRIVSRGISREQEILGRTIARLLVQQATDPLLVSDVVALHALVNSTAARAEDGLAYCFILRHGQVVASSFHDGTPPDLLHVRAAGDFAPFVVVSSGKRILDVAEPILDDVGVVRVGFAMDTVAKTRRTLAIELGVLTLLIAVLGIAAAFVLGRRLARPASEMLTAAQSFDPGANADAPKVSPRGSDEIAFLGRAFNGMMDRLRAAHAEQERARQKSIETERMVALGSLVAGVAHEVNNPLAGLKNCIRRLEGLELPAEKRREYLSLMSEGLDRIEDVMKRLLDFGRPRPTALAEVGALDLTGDVTRLLGPLLHERHISCVIDGQSGSDVRVFADRRLVAQALLNVLLNAIYVTPGGGHIDVRIVRRDGLAGIAIADQGPGIPAEIRERILDPFFSTKPEGEGTGLGLSVTRSIVDAHGGELTFEFPETGGTVATVWLRTAEATAARAVG